MNQLFPFLDDDALLWVWITDRPLTDLEESILRERLNVFTTSWSSHGRQVNSGVDFVDKRILLIAADVDAGDISGCGIDKSVHLIERVGSDLGFGWLDAMTVAFKTVGSGQILSATRAEFRAMALSGEVLPDALVYERNPVTLGRGRTDGLLRPASETWTSRYFEASQSSAGRR